MRALRDRTDEEEMKPTCAEFERPIDADPAISLPLGGLDDVSHTGRSLDREIEDEALHSFDLTDAGRLSTPSLKTV